VHNFPFSRPKGNVSFGQHDKFMNDFDKATRRFEIVWVILTSFITIAFLGMIVAAGLHYSGITPGRARQRAEGLATTYAINVNSWQNPWVQCAGVDNDGNGYVTCMISDRAGRTEQIECADQGITDNLNNICRPYRSVNIITNNTNTGN
jgi:hypothetical protein